MMIGLDIRTLVFILGITHLLQVVVFYQQYLINKTYPGVGWWLMWSAAEAIGFGALLLRDNASLLSTVILVQNIMIVAGTVFIYIGVIRFFDRKPNLKLLIPIIIVYPASLLYFLLIDDNIQIRSGLLSLVLSLTSFITAYSLFFYKIRFVKTSANFLAVVFLLHGILFLSRSVMILTSVSFENFFNPTLFNVFPYLDALIVSLLWTFGFIIMLNQRLNVEMTEAQENLQLIFRASPVAAIITRLDDGKIVDFNEAYSILSGYTFDELYNKSTIDINIWKNPSDRQQIVGLIKEQGYCKDYEALFVTKSGSEIIGHLSANVTYLQGIAHMISITHDITEHKKAELSAQIKNEELQLLNAEKDKFFSIIAHDLRSPFNGFLGLTQIMADELPSLSTAEIKQIALNLRNSATNLFRLLENLLDWSRIQQGLIPFDPEIGLLLPILTESIEMVKDNARAKKIAIICEIADDFQVYADRNMLSTIIRNLVTNAVKFTPKEGTVILSATTNEANNAEISIKDSGIGINNNLIDQLFQPHLKINRKGTEGEATSGLGLLLCQEFTERHGGKIWVKSEVDKGSDFRFTLPPKKEK